MDATKPTIQYSFLTGKKLPLYICEKLSHALGHRSFTGKFWITAKQLRNCALKPRRGERPMDIVCQFNDLKNTVVVQFYNLEQLHRESKESRCNMFYKVNRNSETKSESSETDSREEKFCVMRSFSSKDSFPNPMQKRFLQMYKTRQLSSPYWVSEDKLQVLDMSPSPNAQCLSYDKAGGTVRRWYNIDDVSNFYSVFPQYRNGAGPHLLLHP